jgi:7,8-dihydropterin-6-yl-methyl-4-(beta-D-ribofuranosyl)aminobenzene 5'-phosphate synthase
MTFRISPLWWPVMTVLSPMVVYMARKRNKRFEENLRLAETLNAERLKQATPIDLPELEFAELTVLVEEMTEEGFMGDAAVSYLFKTDRGSLLFDIGFGAEHPALEHNSAKLGFTMEQADALMISHLHLDHMGGMRAMKNGTVLLPETLGDPTGKPCYLPDQASADRFDCQVIDKPKLLPSGIATTGPLSRSLFFFGLLNEQALVLNLKGKGLIVFTGCGHPTIELILKMVRRISDLPIYAIGGGLHFPLKKSRGARAGIQAQMIFGTGKPPWKKIDDQDLSDTIAFLNNSPPKKIYLSAHDSCDYAIDRMKNEIAATTEILNAGKTYKF